jgi:DNA gyrase/topoisomerase IV subunit A
MKIVYLAATYKQEFSKQISDLQSDYLLKLTTLGGVISIQLPGSLPDSSLSDSGINVKELTNPTAGALVTAAFALSEISIEENFLIVPSNSVIPISDLRDFSETMSSLGATVGAIVFRSSESRLSYARKDQQGTLVEIVEKQVVGDSAFAGIYYFSKKDDFKNCVQWSLVNNFQSEGIYYISPSLNYFLANSIQIDLFEIDTANYLRFDTESDVTYALERWLDIHESI